MKKIILAIFSTAIFVVSSFSQTLEWIKLIDNRGYPELNSLIYFNDSSIILHSTRPNNNYILFKINSFGDSVKSLVTTKNYFTQPLERAGEFFIFNDDLYNQGLTKIKPLPGQSGSCCYHPTTSNYFGYTNLQYPNYDNFSVFVGNENGIKYSQKVFVKLTDFGSSSTQLSQGFVNYVDDNNNYYFTIYAYNGSEYPSPSLISLTVGGQVFNGLHYLSRIIIKSDTLANLTAIVSPHLKDSISTNAKDLKIDSLNNYYLNITGEDNNITMNRYGHLYKMDVNGKNIWRVMNYNTHIPKGYGPPCRGRLDLYNNITYSTCNSIRRVSSTGTILFDYPVDFPVYAVVSDKENSVYFTGQIDDSMPNPFVLDCYTISGLGTFAGKLYTGTLPSSPKLTAKGIALKSNFHKGLTWYRNDTLLEKETDSIVLALKDGKYKFKSFCKEDTLIFRGLTNSSGVFSTVSIPGAVYQWYLNDVLIPDAVSNIYSSNVKGKYVVKISFDANQAKYSSGRSLANNSTAIYSLNTSLLGVENDYGLEENFYFGAFPNPTSQSVTFKMTRLVQNGNVYLCNSLGLEVLKVPIDDIQVTIDISSLPRGIYTVKIENSVQKLVIK